jgi:hypothetical protein
MPNITLRQMEVFVAIVEEGSFSAAADRFGIAHLDGRNALLKGIDWEKTCWGDPSVNQIEALVCSRCRQAPEIVAYVFVSNQPKVSSWISRRSKSIALERCKGYFLDRTPRTEPISILD